MSTAVTTPRNDRVELGQERGRPAKQECRRLARQDAVAARLAELHRIRALLQEAEVVVSTGWVQNAWFAVTGTQGGQVPVSAHDLQLVEEGPVSGACLVGGIVHAAGGPAAVHTQLVQRTLDLTWHALREDERRPVRWCPSPEVRAAHVRDLTRWNDQPRRTAEEVVSLLRSAVGTADAQIGLCRTCP